MILCNVPARVCFSEFFTGDDLEDTEQLASVGEVGEEFAHLHLGLQKAIL